MKKYKRAPVLILLTIILWGSAFPAIHTALQSFDSFHLAPYRFLVASLSILVYACLTRIPLPKRQDVLGLLFSGAIGIGVYNLALNTGQKTISAGASSLLINTAPIWTAIMARTFLNDHLPWKAWIGIFISFAGALIIAAKNGTWLTLDHGAILVLIASLSHSIYIVRMKRHIQTYGAVAATTYTIIAGTLFLFLFSGGLGTAINEAPLSASLLVVYLGIFPAALAYVLWAHVLSMFSPARAASFLYFVPLAAVFISWIWIGEVPSWRTLVGGILVVLGVMLVNRNRESLK